MKMKTRVKFALVSELLFCLPSFCQAPNCKAAETTWEQRACAQHDLESAERNMNIAFRKALEAYAPDAAELKDESRMDGLDRAEAIRYRTAMQHDLQMSQRAWLSYRKIACTTVLAMYESGTAGPANELGCRETLTRERTNHLLSYYVQR
jgi:uncharacterized protein YecT (DUF1311 family)